MSDYMRVGAPRLDPLMDTGEESAASRWIRQRANELIDAGIGVPNAFQQARADYAQLAMRDGAHAVHKVAKSPQK